MTAYVVGLAIFIRLLVMELDCKMNEHEMHHRSSMALDSRNDLLAVLEDLLPRFVAVCRDDDGICAEDRERINKAIAAIAKAKGS